MLQNIPTHVIAGPLGAGKTSLIRQLMAQRPADERWAVLINEFGQIGLDAALLTTGDEGIALGEVAGGCLCCVNGAPFQVGLARLLRKARPDRLLIEPSGLGHPLQLMKQLSLPPWQGVLAVQPCIMVLDAQALACGQPFPQAQQQALPLAGLILMNKSDGIDLSKRLWITEQFAGQDVYWTEQGLLPFSRLPGWQIKSHQAVDNLALPEGAAQTLAVWTDPHEPICLSQALEEGWSIGWRWHPAQRFDPLCLQQWLASLNWLRAKLVIHSPSGWQSGNALDQQPLDWRKSEWRKDSRIELIFSEPQDRARLEKGLRACRLV